MSTCPALRRERGGRVDETNGVLCLDIVGEDVFVTAHRYNHLFLRKILNSTTQATIMTSNVTGYPKLHSVSGMSSKFIP